MIWDRFGDILNVYWIAPLVEVLALVVAVDGQEDGEEGRHLVVRVVIVEVDWGWWLGPYRSFDSQFGWKHLQFGELLKYGKLSGHD